MRRAAALPLASALALALPAGAAAETIDIPSAAHLAIVGESPGAGNHVSGAGDVNGDGIPDVIVSDTRVGTLPEEDAAVAAYVVFGRRTPATVTLGSLGSGGFRINGQVESVGAAGDVNGDGRADVLVTAPRADFNGRAQAGSAYVVFGKATTAAVDLATLGFGGFRIGGPRPLETGGVARAFVPVDGAGDVNGDGRSDVIVGFAEGQCIGMVPSCTDWAGSAFVVFGKTTSGAVDTAALGSAGFSISGANAGAAVAGLGDLNGDGIPDVAVSKHYGNSGWVVFGRRAAVNVDLTALGANGFSITDNTETQISPTQSYPLGSVAWSLDGPGDVNGDGRADLLVGVGNFTEIAGFPQRAAVIFGGTSTAPVDIASLGTRGFTVEGGDRFGSSATAAGDVNGDGRADAILNGIGQLGSGLDDDLGAVVVFGKSSTTPLDATALGAFGVNLTGAFQDTEGNLRSVGGAGDVTGDGVADVVVGAPSPGVQSGVGHAYVVSLKPSALRRLDELRFTIATFGLPVELRDRFFRRLDRIKQAIVNGHQPAACRRLDRLIGLAQRLNGNRLTAAQAFTIVAIAGRARSALGCG
jgi:hypothetical protein